MKNTIYFFLTGVLLFGMGACTKSEFEYQGDYERSYQVWQDFKRSSNNTYYYAVTRSTWAGSTWQTTITVDQGKVSRRSFHYSVFQSYVMPTSGWTIQQAQDIVNASSTPETPYPLTPEDLLKTLSWTEENESEIGSHKASNAANPATLDEIYALAKEVWLVKRPDASISFEAENNGLISSAGYVPQGCVDDCFFGITITAIEPLHK